MKRFFFFTLFLLVLGGIEAAREREQFLRGNKVYHEGDVQQALQEYQDITNKGPVLWYNSGVCHLKQNNLLLALVAFKRAQYKANPALFDTVTPVIMQLQTMLHQPHDSELLQFARQCAAYLSLFWLQLLLLVLWWTYTLVSWFTVALTRSIKTVLVLLMMVLSFLTGMVWWVQLRDTAVVMNESSLFVGPNKEFHTVGSVTPGTTVIIKERAGQWNKIATQGSIGWIEREQLEPIES